MKLPVEGACLCGAVRVRITQPPLLTLACHCRDCQKLSASAYSLAAIFPAEGVTVTGDLIPGGLQSPERAHRFCARCLTLILTRIKGAEARVTLRVSLLEDLGWFTPFVELMTDEKLPWAHVPATHSFARHPSSAAVLDALLADFCEHSAP